MHSACDAFLLLLYRDTNTVGWAPCRRLQGDHSPDNVKFPDGSQHSSTALGMLSVIHIMPVLVLLSVVGVGIQQCMIRNHIFNI